MEFCYIELGAEIVIEIVCYLFEIDLLVYNCFYIRPHKFTIQLRIKYKADQSESTDMSK